jgi:hypothetical protein
MGRTMAEGFISRTLTRLIGARQEDALVRYIVGEAGRGRMLGDILDDPYVRNRSDDTTVHRILDRPELVNAVGRDAVEGLRAQLAALGH